LASVNAKTSLQPAALILLAHAIDVGPEPLFEPADLAKHLIAALHHLLAVQIGRVVGELVDEAAAGIDELAEGGRGPVRDEGLVEGRDVRFRGRAGEGRCEARGVVPSGPAALSVETTRLVTLFKTSWRG